MKDEEMAEESFKRYRTTDEDYEDLNGKEKLLVFNHEYGAEEQYHRLYKQGFLAGLKAGRKEWHTDPNDLPPMIQDERHISDRVWINIENWGTEDGYYDYKKNCWIIRCRIVNLPILGWIEIPTFDKE